MKIISFRKTVILTTTTAASEKENLFSHIDKLAVRSQVTPKKETKL